MSCQVGAQSATPEIILRPALYPLNRRFREACSEKHRTTRAPGLRNLQ